MGSAMKEKTRGGEGRSTTTSPNWLIAGHQGDFYTSARWYQKGEGGGCEPESEGWEGNKKGEKGQGRRGGEEAAPSKAPTKTRQVARKQIARGHAGNPRENAASSSSWSCHRREEVKREEIQ